MKPDYQRYCDLTIWEIYLELFYLRGIPYRANALSKRFSFSKSFAKSAVCYFNSE